MFQCQKSGSSPKWDSNTRGGGQKASAEHSYHQYTILVEPDRLGCSRDEMVTALKELGIGTGVHYPRPLHQQPAFENRFGKVSLPVVEGISERILSLPVFPKLQEAELARIVAAMKEVASRTG